MATVFKWIHFGPKNQNGRTVRRTARTVKDQTMTEGYWRQTGSSSDVLSVNGLSENGLSENGLSKNGMSKN